MKLNYLLDKIQQADIQDKPFPHLEIKDFLQPAHLVLFTDNDQIHFPPVQNISQLTIELAKRNYKVQGFPGCTTKLKEYLYGVPKGKTVEGWGICYRLFKYKNSLLQKLMSFLNSEEWHNAIKRKFSIVADTTCFSAIQKQLTGYEISPHPDIRAKCVTYLLNVNSAAYTGGDTSLFRFKREHRHVYDFWGKNEHLNRFWVPWDWCTAVKTIKENNTLLLFPTSNYSLHGIKLNYDHLIAQRTQIYGNLMYNNPIKTKHIGYEVCL